MLAAQHTPVLILLMQGVAGRKPVVQTQGFVAARRKGSQLPLAGLAFQLLAQESAAELS
eukprot:CAMPEP_0172724756 /NCGR_PEP_ID=MMETSP1074-20121228/86781_1 /TAXON_ID=2916 /ORGANISM="Ceratium fusus, Strain PA161109" /LENGTH=58 /DNA_ID=CAMNT_0013551321 /DNA_START=617 /DNA_END=793 /DNA_ORIENTATION=+